MKSLIIIEHDNSQMKPSNLSAVTAALDLKQGCDALVMGYECQSVCEQIARVAGIDKVIAVDQLEFSQPLAETQARVIFSLASNYSAILASSSTYGKNLLPRVAAMLEVCQVSDVTKIINQSIFEHPIYAGNVIETVEVLDPLKVLTIRPTAFNPAEFNQKSAAIETLTVDDVSEMARFISRELSVSERPELTEATIIVSGGRGLQSAEKFALIEELADCVGAAIGASRAAVDAGFVPNDYQVGQTGKVVAPSLYFAIGISGAVQHLAGMKDSKVIVAINKDEDAPIFQIATYGLVGDLFELVPQLIEQLRSKS